MTRGRVVPPGTVAAEQEPFFISLGGPKARDFSGRDDKGRVVTFWKDGDLDGRRWEWLLGSNRRPLTCASLRFGMTVLLQGENYLPQSF